MTSSSARPNIVGADHVAVYTDEHGEAFVAYNPNTGFRWNADSNGRCNLVPGTLGTATITAEALYPDQPVPLGSDQQGLEQPHEDRELARRARRSPACPRD